MINKIRHAEEMAVCAQVTSVHRKTY